MNYLCHFCDPKKKMNLAKRSWLTIGEFAKHIHDDHIAVEQEKQPSEMNFDLVDAAVKYRNKMIALNEIRCKHT